MQEHLPRALSPMESEDMMKLQAAGDETERRLITELRDKKSWKAPKASLSGMYYHFTPYFRASNITRGGCAYSCCFTMAVPAARMYQHIQQLQISGSLDPGT